MKKIIKTKEEARQYAIEWQNTVANKDLSYTELVAWGHVFEELGRKWGLLKEFKENGII